MTWNDPNVTLADNIIMIAGTPNFQEKPKWIWERTEEVQMLAKMSYKQPALCKPPNSTNFKIEIIEILNLEFELELIQHETIVFAKYSAVYAIRGFTCS